MNAKLKQDLYWDIRKKFDDIDTYLFAAEGDKPTYGSDSLMDNYGIYETTDTKLIFEEVVKEFKMSNKDKPYLWKLLTDFSIEKFFNDKYDHDFVAFLEDYNFRIGVCTD